MGAIEHMIREADFEVTLFPDGSTPAEVAGGTLPDALLVINFGDTDDPARESATLPRRARTCHAWWRVLGWLVRPLG